MCRCLAVLVHQVERDIGHGVHTLKTDLDVPKEVNLASGSATEGVLKLSSFLDDPPASK